MNYSLFLFFVLLTTLSSVYTRAPFHSKKSPKETIHNYDIVYLELIKSDISDSQSNKVYPQVLQVAIKGTDSAVQFNLDLNLNEGLLARHFTSVHHENKGSTEISQGHPNCFYHGVVRGRNKWRAVFSTCHGLRGWFGDLNNKESVYHLEPLNDDKELSGPYVLYKDTEHKEIEPGTCGTPHGKDNSDNNHIITTPERGEYNNHRVKRTATASNTGPNIVELLVVNDFHQFQVYLNNISAVVLRAVEIINHVDWLYSSINVRVSLVHSLTWTTSQQIANENEAGALLRLFKTYHSDHVPFRSITHDSAQMITGIDLAGSTIGIAFVGTMCSYDNSVGVTQDTRGSIASVATTAAHEMGHTFDMDHDDAASCNCPVTTGEGCIMNAVSGFPPATNWSQCSINELNSGFNTRNLNRCLGNNPTTIVGEARCGNGIKEPDETCDCGSVAECNDPCCNATTCTLNDDADCGSGVCCNNCKFVAYGTKCRNASGGCDIMEYCSGDSSDCPQDVSVQNGFPCSNDNGYCYGGQCGTHASQCLLYYGSASTPANEICYTNYNTRGEGFGHCGSNGQSFIPCQSENVQCGSLQCQGGSLQNVNTRHSYVSYTNSIGVFQCRAFSTPATVDEISPGLVSDGTKCGNNSLCVTQNCVTLDSLSISPCPLGRDGQTCAGNGVCNNLDTCSCNVGFTGANCAQIHGQNGGDNSGSNSGNSVVGGVVGGIFVVIVIVAISVAVVVVVLLVMKNRKKSVDLRASPSKAKYSRAPTNKKVTVSFGESNDGLLMNNRPYVPPSQSSSQPPAYNPYIPPTYSPSGSSGSPSVTVNNARVPPPRPAPGPPASNKPRAPPPKPPVPVNRPPPGRPPVPVATKPTAPPKPTAPAKPIAPPKPQTAPKPSARMQWPPPSSEEPQKPLPSALAKKPIPPPRR